jgi:hypothetical protein
MKLFAMVAVSLGALLGGCQGASLGDCAQSEAVCGSVCADLSSDRDNCGECGNACGDGLVCGGGTCMTGCDNGLEACGGACVDTATDPNNCGGCGASDPANQCAADEVCSNGTCGCAAPKVTCGGTCTDPKTSNQFCGATGDCTGANAGETCGANEACLDGTCTSTLIYRGSLPAGTGRWQYNGTLGIAGANALCEQHWPGSQICTYDKLLAASQKTPAETLNATDFNGAAVTSWWVDDPAVTEGRCTSNADAIPWSYATADQGHVGKYVDLTPGTGAVSAFLTGTLPSCNQNRNVACCSTTVLQ